jgi:predicted acyl esterase
MSNVFNPRHCIRQDICSSNFPRFDVTTKTGGPIGHDPRGEAARQLIY